MNGAIVQSTCNILHRNDVTLHSDSPEATLSPAPPPDRFNAAAHLLALNATRGDKLAYIDDQERLSYGALAERNDVRRLNNTVEVELKVKGLTFNTVDTTAFRGTLKKAGFYKDWKAKYGADAWAILEKYSGKLE